MTDTLSDLQVQAALVFLGYNPGTLDGQSGPKTRAALSSFAAAYGLQDQPEDVQRASLVAAIAKTIQPLQDPFQGIRHFRPKEFTCKCGGRYCKGDTATMDHGLLVIDDQIRDHFDAVTTITSGVRCPQHNANEGGVYNSRHLTGHANDLIVRGFSSDMVLAYVQTLPGVNYAYAIDGSAVHIDTK